jgi:hypothetical protein
MVLPLVLILLSVGSAVVVAYGTESDLARYAHGLEWIMMSRRLQWPLVTLSLVLCIALIALVIAGKHRAWWLIGLAPVLALFAHRFATRPANAFTVAENPVMLAPDAAASFVGDDDSVVGLIFDGEAYAFPYAALYGTPVVLQAEHDRRLIVLFSAFANRALAFQAARELKARDLDIVSFPANALLVYNSRLGEFINGLTGQTTSGERPDGIGEPVETVRTTFGAWRNEHPRTRVMLPTVPLRNPPRQPVLPTKPMPGQLDLHGLPVATAIAFVASDPPLALPMDRVTGPDAPLNLSTDDVPLLIFRDPQTRQVIAFDRRFEPDLWPQFKANLDSRRKGAFIDADTNTAWSLSGVALDGERKGKKLKQFPVEENLYWGVMKHWYPRLTIEAPATQPAAEVSPPPIIPRAAGEIRVALQGR